MKIVTLKEMVGAVVPEITGEIIKLWPSKNGVTNGKSWSLQGGTIKDETGEIDFTIWNRTELPQSLRGVTMTLKSIVGVKGGLRGLKVEKNKKDTTKLVLQVEDKAQISDKEGSIQEDAKDDIPMELERGTAELTNERSTFNKPKLNVDEALQKHFSQPSHSKSPQDRIAQFGKLYLMCLKEAYTQYGECDGRDAPGNHDRAKDVASCLFIQSVREGLADKMEVEGEAPF